MSEQSLEEQSLTRKITDAALLVAAVIAIGAWLWRRLRRPASVDHLTTEATAIDDKVGAAVGFATDDGLAH